MTEQENNKYYQTVLVELGLTYEQINYLLEQHPIGKAVVKEDDRQEGKKATNVAKRGNGERVLLLYRTDGSKWVGISSFNKIVTIETKYFGRKHYLYRLDKMSNQQQKDFVINHFPSLNSNLDEHCSNGERLVSTALFRLGYPPESIIKEYQAPELIGFETLWARSPRYDYAVLDENKNPIMFIEFDGEQHYKGEGYNFSRQFYRDKAKEGYAFFKRIPLIRIPFGVITTEDNIGTIISGIKTYLSAESFKQAD